MTLLGLHHVGYRINNRPEVNSGCVGTSDFCVILLAASIFWETSSKLVRLVFTLFKFCVRNKSVLLHFSGVRRMVQTVLYGIRSHVLETLLTETFAWSTFGREKFEI